LDAPDENKTKRSDAKNPPETEKLGISWILHLVRIAGTNVTVRSSRR